MRGTPAAGLVLGALETGDFVAEANFVGASALGLEAGIDFRMGFADAEGEERGEAEPLAATACRLARGGRRRGGDRSLLWRVFLHLPEPIVELLRERAIEDLALTHLCTVGHDLVDGPRIAFVLVELDEHCRLELQTLLCRPSLAWGRLR